MKQVEGVVDLTLSWVRREWTYDGEGRRKQERGTRVPLAWRIERIWMCTKWMLKGTMQSHVHQKSLNDGLALRNEVNEWASVATKLQDGSQLSTLPH